MKDVIEKTLNQKSVGPGFKPHIRIFPTVKCKYVMNKLVKKVYTENTKF